MTKHYSNELFGILNFAATHGKTCMLKDVTSLYFVRSQCKVKTVWRKTFIVGKAEMSVNISYTSLYLHFNQNLELCKQADDHFLRIFV